MSAQRPPSASRHIVLIGLMGAGKTTTGQALADRLGWPLRDCDADLEARTGRTGAQIAAREGIDHLHDLEERVLLDALATDGPAVITGAGWVVESAACREAMAARATVVWLDAPIDELVARMAASDHRRPVGREDAEALLVRRLDRFEKVTDLRMDAGRPTDVLVDEIVSALAER